MLILSQTIPFYNDPVGNTIAVLTLILMIVSAIFVIFFFKTNRKTWLDQSPEWIIPLLAILGAIIASYLFFIESSNSTPYCGPVGDCGTVQNSQYAFLFGFIPVGLLGIIGYLIIIFLWLASRFFSGTVHHFFGFVIWFLSWIGLLFSIYLTFLEPFVIGATCMWCISSAIIMTGVLWVSTGSARKYWATLMDENSEELNEHV
jgi:uncharacterized membrane protein